jgi:hypothetical protein
MSIPLHKLIFIFVMLSIKSIYELYIESVEDFFLNVVKTQSVTKASEALNLTQLAVSILTAGGNSG